MMAIIYRAIFLSLALLLLTSEIELTPTSYDFIVVGAGSAGSAVAGRLSEDPSVSVLLVEAGGEPPVESEIPGKSMAGDPQCDWVFKVKPQTNACKSYPNNQCYYFRGKCLGGTSTINSMMYIRGNHKDYDNWAAMGNSGWNWEGIKPFYLKAEGNTIGWLKKDVINHNSDGPLTTSQAPYHTKTAELFLDSAVELGYKIIDVNGDSQMGFCPIAFTMRNGSRCSTYKAYLIPALKRSNLKILTHSHVLKVLFDNNNKAVGVSISTNGTVYNVTAKKEVIISAGAIQSPQILMLSGVGPAEHLKKFNIPVVADLRGVGQNLKDHVISLAMSFTSTTLQTISQATLTSEATLKEWQDKRRGPLTVSSGLEANGFVSSINASSDVPDLQLAITTTGNPFLMGAKKASFSIYEVILQPKSTGSVSLQTADPFDDPLIDPQYLSHDDDVNTLLKGARIALKFVETSPFVNQTVKFNTEMLDYCNDFELLSDEYIKCAIRHNMLPGLHASGTCKMGIITDKMAVVNPDGLKVYKVTGLRVIDTSVMPNIVSGNTNAAAIAIGEKGAQYIKTQYGLV